MRNLYVPNCQIQLQKELNGTEINTIDMFRTKTEKYFLPVNNMSAKDIESYVIGYVKDKLDEYDIGGYIVDAVVSGSRCRGLEKVDSDLDVVVELVTEAREDYLFNILHEDDLLIGNVKLDINPITEAKTGTLTEYLPGVESYLAQKRLLVSLQNIRNKVKGVR